MSQYQKGKTIWILLKQETVSGSGISWAICKSAPPSRQTTTPIPHHSVFYRPDALPATQPTASITEGTKTSPHHPPLFTARLHCCNYPQYLKQPILTLKQTNCNTLSLVCLHVIALATQSAPYQSRIYPYLLNYRE